MANSLEMLHYLQCNLNALMQNFPSHQASVRDSLVAADEELLTVLEEVIMFTFQQTVYHLTKVKQLFLVSHKLCHLETSYYQVTQTGVSVGTNDKVIGQNYLIQL